MESIDIKMLSQICFLLSSIFGTSDINVLNEDTINTIVLQPINNLEIRCYLIEERRLKLWLFLLDTRLLIKIPLGNKKIVFQRNELFKKMYIRVSDFVRIELFLDVKIIETSFDVRIYSFTRLGISEVEIKIDDFYKNINLEAVYAGEKLKLFKKDLRYYYPLLNIQGLFLLGKETEKIKEEYESRCCSIF